MTLDCTPKQKWTAGVTKYHSQKTINNNLLIFINNVIKLEKPHTVSIRLINLNVLQCLFHIFHQSNAHSKCQHNVKIQRKKTWTRINTVIQGNNALRFRRAIKYKTCF